MTRVRMSEEVRQIVLDRSGGVCELAGCGANLYVVPGSVHHRRPARMGGDRRPETHAASNGLAICGSGTTGCHGRVEGSGRRHAIEDGIILTAIQDPKTTPVLTRHGWVLLGDDGTYETLDRQL